MMSLCFDPLLDTYLIVYYIMLNGLEYSASIFERWQLLFVNVLYHAFLGNF